MTDRAALARPAAIVTSATVDVHVLRIGAKQMTLAVFRQLHRDDALDGPMWGTVNYCHRLFDWPCDPKHPEGHQHIVWQDGSELRHGMRRTIIGIGSEHATLCFNVATRHWVGRSFDQQEIVDHAATFNTSQLRTLVRKLDDRHKYNHHTWLDTFMTTEGGTWRQEYPELERRERPFESLPQLFIAV
jgi:hypothetical protein